MSSPTKLEIGCGQRPTDGYAHNDMNAFDGVDYVCPAWKIGLPDRSLDEVVALGVIEHLQYEEVRDTFRNVHRMLKSGGVFLFDVPDIITWCRYLVDDAHGKSVPFEREHIMSTLYGWQRWPGDEHKSGWTRDLLTEYLAKSGFLHIRIEPAATQFKQRGFERNRFERPLDAHFYVTATK